QYIFSLSSTNETATTKIYTLSLHDALPISGIWTTFYDMTLNLSQKNKDYEDFSNQEKMLTFFYTFFELLTANRSYVLFALNEERSEEHTSELQSRENLVCRLLLEKKKGQRARDGRPVALGLDVVGNAAKPGHALADHAAADNAGYEQQPHRQGAQG